MDMSGIKHLSPVSEPGDLSKYKFSDYAQDYHSPQSPRSHIRGSLRKPLHFQSSEQNYEASLTIFHVIQRFMMDLPEPKHTDPTDEDTVFMRTMARNYDHGEGTTFKRKMESVRTPGWTSLPPLSNMAKPTTNIEKVRFICSYGIYRPELRDEIYNQICVQLIDNQSKTSRSRGWILLALCLGSFLPSEQLYNFLWNFIRQGPDGYNDYCQKRLQRTFAVGGRKLAPASLELKAAKIEGKIMLPLTTMDALTHEYEVDSSTTCEELLIELKQKLNLKSIFGFSIFAKQFDQVFNWGCSNDCVLDVVSLCEQYAIHKNVPEEERNNWSIFVRKDVFLSSHNPANDQVETNLIYAQIMGGIHVGEYRCNDQDELGALLAKRYYIEYGNEMDDENLGKLIENGVPVDELSNTTQEHMELATLIRKHLQTVPSITNSSHPDIMKQEIVSFGKSKQAWSKNFSRIFNAQLISGPKIPRGEVRVFFHSAGVDLLSTAKKGREAFFLNIGLQHISSITNDSPEYMRIKGGRFDTSSYLTIRTKTKSIYTLTSIGAKEMNKLGRVLLNDYR